MTDAIIASKAAAFPPNPQQMESVRNAAQDFEAVFLSEMLSHMFEGIKTDPMFGGGRGEDMFRSMMVQEYAKNMAKSSSGIGLTDQIQRKMIEMQQQADMKG